MSDRTPHQQPRAADEPDPGTRPEPGKPAPTVAQPEPPAQPEWPARPERPVLPDVTSDESAAGWGDWREDRDDDERFLREVPPHHGTY